MNGYPRIYLGQRTVREFKNRVSFPIYQVVTNEELVSFIEKFTGIGYRDIPVIIEDVGYLSRSEQSVLLKFVEESPLKLVLLSSIDAIIPTIISRMSLVYKVSSPVKSNFLSIKKGESRISERLSENTHFFDKCRVQGEECPIGYYYASVIPSNRQRIYGVLEVDGD